VETFLISQRRKAQDYSSKRYWGEALKLYRRLENKTEVDKALDYRKASFEKCGMQPEWEPFVEILRIASGVCVWES
jgi:hypothetical protein